MSSVSPAAAELQQHRQQFPSLANKAYFNFGGQGTMPQLALEAIYKAYEFIQQQGPFSSRVNDWIRQEAQLTRQAIATELHVAPEAIALTDNVTTGCNIAIWGLDWQPGDRILLTDCEHPGVIAIVKEIARRFRVKVTTCPVAATLNRGNPAAVIEQHLQPTTRLVVLSHLLWNTGQVLPLGDILDLCHNYKQSDRPVWVLVDGAQSAGSLALNLTGLEPDFYAFTGHKWFCGPAGVGALYVRPEVLASLSPTYVGWRSVQLDNSGMPINWQPDCRRYEVATSAFPQYAGLRAAIAVHRQWGTAKERYGQICHNSHYLWQKLSELPQVNCLRAAPPEAGIVSFRLNSTISHRQFVEFLEQQNFLLRPLASPDCIRACVHYFTLPSEIDALANVISSL